MPVRRFTRSVLSALLPLIGLGGASPVVRAAEEIPGPVDAVVLKVIDGDTVRVSARIWLNQTVETLVRLKGVDTPELKGACPREKELAAKARAVVMQSLPEGEAVQLLDVEPDKYGGRVVARLQTPDGQDLSAVLIASGLAYAYQGGRKTPWCP